MSQDPAPDFAQLAAHSALAGVQPEWLPADELPRPFQTLLCHEKDMTSTLAHYHDEAILLEVLHVEKTSHSLRREVLLKTARSTIAEYGLIEIDLSLFPPEIHSAITEGLKPLGGILNATRFPYLSQPQGFFRLQNFSPPFLPPSPKTPAYGRFNHLTNPAGTPFARIIEIIP